MVCDLVPVVGGRDDDGVDRLVGEDRAVVAVVLRLVAEPLEGAGDPALVGVADPDHLDAGHGERGVEHARLDARAHADDPDLDPVVGRHDLREGVRLVAQHVGHERGGGRAHQALLHELPAVDPCLHVGHLASENACTLARRRQRVKDAKGSPLGGQPGLRAEAST